MNDVLEILKSVRAILTEDHFVYTSGLHGEIYINKDALYPHTKEASEVGRLFAEKAKEKKIDVVAAPALGGIILSQWTAFHLTQLTGEEVLGVYTEKTPEKTQIFTRGYDKLVKNKNILVIEDLTTTGGSVKKVVDSVKEVGGVVAAVGVMVNRNPEEVTESFIGAPFFALGELPVRTYLAEECPLCEKGIPVNTNVGHGKKFVEGKL